MTYPKEIIFTTGDRKFFYVTCSPNSDIYKYTIQKKKKVKAEKTWRWFQQLYIHLFCKSFSSTCQGLYCTGAWRVSRKNTDLVLTFMQFKIEQGRLDDAYPKLKLFIYNCWPSKFLRIHRNMHKDYIQGCSLHLS